MNILRAPHLTWDPLNEISSLMQLSIKRRNKYKHLTVFRLLTNIILFTFLDAYLFMLFFLKHYNVIHWTKLLKCIAFILYVYWYVALKNMLKLKLSLFKAGHFWGFSFNFRYSIFILDIQALRIKSKRFS